MKQVGEFDKVSYAQFHTAMVEMCESANVEVDHDFIKRSYDAIMLPERATCGSAGYDFKAPFSFSIDPGMTIKIPTGIRAYIEYGWWLACFPRSSFGFKYRMQLDNTCGVVDSDYYCADNEGHIFFKITNDGKEGKVVSVDQGQAFVQGIFLPYGITYSDKATGERNGGMGSTDA